MGSVNAGNLTVPVTFTPNSITFATDGSYVVSLTVAYNGIAARQRLLGVSADGTTFTLDGAPLTPWAALTTLGSAAVPTKVTAVISAPGAVAPLTGP